jgi:hypothetical protein
LIHYYETLIKQQETYKGIEFKSFVESYIDKETNYFVLNLDTIIDDSYSFDKIIDTFQNIYNNNKKLPIDKLMKSIYKIPINDIHNLIVSLTELFFMEYEETCTIYMNYYKNYKNYYNGPCTHIQYIGVCSLYHMYIKEYISTNNINYNILSMQLLLTIINHRSAFSSSNVDYTDKNLEKDIELFLKPFKIFINYINNPEFQAFLDLKRKIAETLKVSNCLKVDKIACAILKEIKEEYKDMSIVDRFKKAFELFNSNVSKYEVVEPLTIVIS